jgi:hypothetical protein
MRESNFIISWKNGCQDKGIGEYVGEAPLMVGCPRHFVGDATGKYPP